MKDTCSIKLSQLLFLLKREGLPLVITFRFVGVALKTHTPVTSPQYLPQSLLWSIIYHLKSLLLSVFALSVEHNGGKNYEQVGRERLRDSKQKADGWKGSPVFPSWVMWTVLAAISCSHTNKALLDLIKIHAWKMEADGFRKRYLCVCMGITVGKNENMREKESRKERAIERERWCMCSLMLEINDEN